jgi:hypothetical protein
MCRVLGRSVQTNDISCSDSNAIRVPRKQDDELTPCLRIALAMRAEVTPS